jgi:hypothetical protein
VAPRAAEVLSGLVGAGTVQFSGVQDNLIVNLPDADTPWFGPSDWWGDAAGWHKDGDWFRHFLDSPEQALLVVVFWRDVVERQGATYVAIDSIGPVARLLADHPEGLDPPALGGPVREILAGCRDFRALTGRQGDIVFAHPFLLHTASVNALTVPRVISNSSVMLCDPMCFDRADDRYTAVERSILAALGVDSFDFRATGPRGREDPRRRRAPPPGGARLLVRHRSAQAGQADAAARRRPSGHARPPRLACGGLDVGHFRRPRPQTTNTRTTHNPRCLSGCQTPAARMDGTPAPGLIGA